MASCHAQPPGCLPFFARLGCILKTVRRFRRRLGFRTQGLLYSAIAAVAPIAHSAKLTAFSGPARGEAGASMMTRGRSAPLHHLPASGAHFQPAPPTASRL